MMLGDDLMMHDLMHDSMHDSMFIQWIKAKKPDPRAGSRCVLPGWIWGQASSQIIYIESYAHIFIYIPRPTASFKFEGSCKKPGSQTQNPVL